LNPLETPFQAPARGKIGFAMLFVLYALKSITFLIIGYPINQKLRVMETINFCAFEIPQVVRFEQNFFLYQTNRSLRNSWNKVLRLEDTGPLKISQKESMVRGTKKPLKANGSSAEKNSTGGKTLFNVPN
jgi:hypothetical protein